MEITDNNQPEETVETEIDTETPTETPESTEGEETPEVTEPEGEEGEQPAEGEEAPEGDEEPFTPNTKITVMDKEIDIPEKYHRYMTDKDSEKDFKEIFEKAEGLPFVKEKLQLTRQENEELRNENDGILQSISIARNAYNSAIQSGDLHKLDKFFNILKVPQDVVLQYAIEKAKLSEMPEDQRNATLARIRSEEAVEAAREQSSGADQRVYAQEVRLKQMELNIEFSQDQVKAWEQEFDTRLGKKNAFREFVINAGKQAYEVEKKDIPIKEAINRVVTAYGLGKAPAQTVAQPQATQTQNSPGQQAPVKRTTQTIPNVQGRGTSPLKNKPKSLDEVTKYRKETYGF